MFVYVLAMSMIVAAQTLDFTMSPEEKRQTGVNKLSAPEKAALQTWIDNHYVLRGEPLASAAATHGMLQQNLSGGSYIQLSDGSMWNIHPKDTPITQSWITPVDILISQTNDPDYPFRLTNSLTGSSVRAKRAQSLPTAAPAAPKTMPPANTKTY